VEAEAIVAGVAHFFASQGRLAGKRALVTSGPTHEPIDPVRYIANRSSGKQGHAIARALAQEGAATVLVTGPSHQPDPKGVAVMHVETAAQMLAACESALPVDAAVCAAAVSDWRPVAAAGEKIKKAAAAAPPGFELAANPDILKIICGAGNRRPRLVVGFAAETERLLENARAKLEAKGCDWIVANDVSGDGGGFGGDDNRVHLITRDAEEAWPRMAKEDVAARLAGRIADELMRDAKPS